MSIARDQFNRMPHHLWRRWAVATKRSRLTYVKVVMMTTEFAALLRQALGVRLLDKALGGPVEILDELPEPQDDGDHVLRIMQPMMRVPMGNGRNYYVRRRHDGKVDPPPDMTDVEVV